MTWNLVFFLNSMLLGVGLAMDAFSVSLANGLNEPKMGKRRICLIAGTFALFQAVMPMTGWFCVHTLVMLFHSFEPFIPWISLLLLCYIGGKMLLEGLRGGNEEGERRTLGPGMLLMQGIATSIDALSVGFTIAEYDGWMALVCALIIASVTFVICTAGLLIGRSFGTRFAGKASVLGGAILILIGIEILVTGLMG